MGMTQHLSNGVGGQPDISVCENPPRWQELAAVSHDTGIPANRTAVHNPVVNHIPRVAHNRP